jgi:RNA recognition motif-containing protein
MKLFVGKLPYELTEDKLREIFEKIGTVLSAKVVMDRYTGQSRGFGFVEMSNQDEAKKAMDELDGTEVMGRSIVVKKANDKEAGGPGGGGDRGGDRGGGDRDRRGPPRGPRRGPPRGH